jgi:hypothetical protein
MSGLTNVAGLLQLADESWVDGGFEAFVSEVREVAKKDKSGSFFVAKLNDGPGTADISLSLFSAPKFAQGDKIRIAGKGIKRSSYNGKPQVGLGKTTGVTVVASGGNTPAPAAPAGGATPSSGGQAPQAMIPGPTVGMAVNNALTLLTQGMGHADVVKATREAVFWTTAYETASQIIRLSKSLEGGKLAPSVWDKVAQTPAPQPPPAHNPAKELDEDPPF